MRAIIALIALGAAPCAIAQSGGGSRSPSIAPDRTLEIAPRFNPSPPAFPESTPTPNSSSDTGGNDLQDQADKPPSDDTSARPRPYLGVGVQFIESNDQPGRTVRGLEIVSVDPGSPADRAGLRGAGSMTTLGASGATAGALMAPLDLIFMPLLKKAGQLGQSGDLIVAIDDKRVESATDLQDELDQLKPGDILYFTLVRTPAKGEPQTLKLRVQLGEPEHTANIR
jgi:S1-C subfamily serine protease